jgi:segregation and condensation protein A
VDGAIATVLAVLELRATARWRDVCPESAAPWQVLSALLALLELARRGELRLAQLSPFASVLISRESASQAA